MAISELNKKYFHLLYILRNMVTFSLILFDCFLVF